MTIISFDLNVEHSMNRDALSNWLEYINAFSGIKSCDPRTVDNFIADLTGIGFFCSSDGVHLFKSRTNFAIWLIMLLNLNLPPDERVKLENVILCGFVPGPKNPQDLDSYMHFLVQEFILLQSKSGVQVWN